MLKNLINIHSHIQNDDHFTIVNLFPENHNKLSQNRFYSIGLHPWNVNYTNYKENLLIVESYSEKPNIIAVGEAGLDKYKPNFDLQKTVFEKQIETANNREKPLIVHCVKAYSELLERFKKNSFKIPVIIHRFSGNNMIFGQLLKYNCYLSFGHELFDEKRKTADVFKEVPISRIFLETDDSDLTIDKVYEKAAELKGLCLDKLIEQILENFENCFRKKL